MENNNLEDVKGNVINIQHYSYQDGPGVRTTVFLKGCSLHCKWCSNPESICRQNEIAFDQKECIGYEKCGRCLQKPFPDGCFFKNEENGKVSIDWTKTDRIDLKLASLCPCKAVFTYGKSLSIKEVIEEVDQDIAFYSANNGGITVSGGEPLLQPEFVSLLLKTAHSHGYSTAIETALNVPWESVEKVLAHVDVVIHDIKMIDSKKHAEWTGVDNAQILENAIRAYQKFPNKKFIVRTPVIPGVNDSTEEISKIIDYIIPYKNVEKYELLPYHRLGLGKYDVLGKEYTIKDIGKTDDSNLSKLREMISNRFERER